MTVKLKGTNLSGGDVSWWKYEGKADGPLSGRDYLFVTTADIDGLIADGHNIFRLLFSWEAVQDAPWVVPGKSAKPAINTYWNTYKALVDYITSKGKVCVVDIHGGMGQDGQTGTVGAAWKGNKFGTTFYVGANAYVVDDMFINLWWNLAGIFKSNPLVWFGITNEPVGITQAVWYGLAQKVIHKIRSVGANNHITMPGNFYSGAGSWAQANGTEWLKLIDPANNMSVQAHTYFDPNNGGGTPDIAYAEVGKARISNAVNWCRATGKKLFIGELGLSGSQTLSKETWRITDEFMEANADVIVGWAWWTYGPPSWWGNYQFNICKTAKGEPQRTLIAASLATTKPIVVDPKDAEIARLLKYVTELEEQVGKLRATVFASQAEIDRWTLRIKELEAKLAEIRVILG